MNTKRTCIVLLLALLSVLLLSSCDEPVLFNFGFGDEKPPVEVITPVTPSVDPTSAPVTDPSTEPVTEPTTEPVTEPVTERVYELADFAAYFRDKIAPVLCAVLSGAGALYVAILPVLTRIKHAYDNFKTATDGVTATAAKGDQNNVELVQLRAQLEHELDLMRLRNEALVSQIDEKFSQYDDKVRSCDTASREILEIVRIGFCNTDELVRKGYAAKIAKVGENHDNEKNGDPSSNTASV